MKFHENFPGSKIKSEISFLNSGKNSLKSEKLFMKKFIIPGKLWKIIFQKFKLIFKSFKFLITKFPTLEWSKATENLLWLHFRIFLEQKPEIAIEVLINEPPRFPTCIQYLFFLLLQTLPHSYSQDISVRNVRSEREREKIWELILFYVYYFKL